MSTEFPKLTWNNYFMITGTYDIQVTNVYTDLAKFPSTFTGPEWKLFRERLAGLRKDWNATDPLSNGIANGGVLVDRVLRYPANNLQPTYSTRVEKLGAAYVEFLPSALLASGDALSVTLDINLPLSQANQYARVSVLPIIQFGAIQPQNVFVTPRAIAFPDRTVSRYTIRIENYKQCNRTTIIVNNVGDQWADYNYNAEVITPAGPPSPSPCLLILP